MVVYALRRILSSIPVLLLVTLVVFLFLHAAPGDPVTFLVGDEASPELAQSLREQYQLDRPIHEQYLHWLGGVLQGDLHRSLRTREPVAEAILHRLPASFTLAVTSGFLSILIAIPVGVISALRKDTAIDRFGAVVSMLGMAVPNFVVGLVLILILGVGLDLLPIAGPPSITREPFRAAPYYIMPTLALGAYFAALQTRLVRASMLEVMGADYLRTARAKGLRERRVLFIHALRNALIPVVTVSALNFAQILGGTIVIEEIFGIPGVGSLFLNSILFRDFPMVQGISLAIALFFILANLAADILYGFIDPRIHIT